MTRKATITPDAAINLLKEGNARYVRCATERPNLSPNRRVLTATEGQTPFAVVLTCSDSRVPVELLFDRGIGDIFVVRVAGNVLGPSELASVEYAVHHVGTPLFAVLGHTKCGAITAVVESGMLGGNLRCLSERILPAVEAAKACNPAISPDRLVNEAVKANVWQVIRDAFEASKCLRDTVKNETLKIVGCVYDIETGIVDWQGTHPEQSTLL